MPLKFLMTALDSSKLVFKNRPQVKIQSLFTKQVWLSGGEVRESPLPHWIDDSIHSIVLSIWKEWGNRESLTFHLETIIEGHEHRVSIEGTCPYMNKLQGAWELFLVLWRWWRHIHLDPNFWFWFWSRENIVVRKNQKPLYC